MFYSLIIKHKKLSSSLNIALKILQRAKLLKNIILRTFCYVTFSQKVNIKRDIQNFLLWAPNKLPFLRKISKIHIAYTLSQNKPVLGLHTEFHGNRFSRSQVMPAQTDGRTGGRAGGRADGRADTGEETWIYQFDLDTKRQSSVESL